jgi:hypothetical protein
VRLQHPVRLHLAVPLSWSLSLVRPVTLRPQPFGGFALWQLLGGLDRHDLFDRRQPRPGRAGALSKTPLRTLFISTTAENFSLLWNWPDARGEPGPSPKKKGLATNWSTSARMHNGEALARALKLAGSARADLSHARFKPPVRNRTVRLGARAPATYAAVACV